MFPEDKFHDECGVFGVFNHPEAANLVYLGLYALQLRGQEGAGIVAAEGRKLSQERGLGLVSDIFSEERIRKLKGTSAIGHNRYSTTGASQVLDNVQPILVNYALGSVAVAHNGNLTNYRAVKDELEAYGSIFHTTIDSELIVHLIAQAHPGLVLAYHTHRERDDRCEGPARFQAALPGDSRRLVRPGLGDLRTRP